MLAKNELSLFICFDFQSPFGWIELVIYYFLKAVFRHGLVIFVRDSYGFVSEILSTCEAFAIV
ncbi:MAG: hypothetical protein CMK50_05500 [Propionibacteriaceae bacterium]|nr:hypothetical protein [Propionibacteriaceae bacterium]